MKVSSSITAYSIACIALGLLLPSAQSRKVGHHKNVIMMVSDGFGVASETMAREYVQQVNKLPVDWMSPLDKIQVGASRTKSANTFITDSAPGATAFSCAKKSYNGAIGVSNDEKPCGTILEAAKLSGMLTGIVVLSSVTDATPAAFASHVVSRNMENLIAQQLVGNRTLGRVVDILVGGGKCRFLPKSNPDSCRNDDLDLWNNAKQYGWNKLDGNDGFKDMGKTELPILNLFLDIPYELDRDPSKQPPLSEMAKAALDKLAQEAADSDTGFFMMIEGSFIDNCGHSNDPACQLSEVLEYWRTIEVVRNFVDSNQDTVMISTSDHETGGLSLGRDKIYKWYPTVLQKVKRTSSAICSDLKSATNPSVRSDLVTTTVLPNWLGIPDYTAAERDEIVNADSSNCVKRVSKIVSKRALLGWTTGGHTGVDVNLYAYGRGSSQLYGNHENTDIGDFMAKYLGVDLDHVTRIISNETTHQAGFAFTHPENSLEWMAPVD
ncbi:alkaline phosphatase-like protein [Martensiomyces pterosporus]|nr:alkaline phosphatase-like protein [Martensiomyces pterosporus]